MWRKPDSGFSKMIPQEARSQPVTVLFIRIGPAAGSKTSFFINQGFAWMIRRIRQAGGKVYAAVGDSLLAIFPGAETQVQAVQTSLALREGMGEFHRWIADGVGNPPIPILTLHQGISSGDVFQRERGTSGVGFGAADIQCDGPPGG